MQLGKLKFHPAEDLLFSWQRDSHMFAELGFGEAERISDTSKDTKIKVIS